MNQNNISLEKVIKGLECHFLVEMNVCEKCPYYSKRNCSDEMAKDALVLLKNLNKKLEETQRAYESALMAQYERPKGY